VPPGEGEWLSAQLQAHVDALAAAGNGGRLRSLTAAAADLTERRQVSVLYAAPLSALVGLFARLLQPPTCAHSTRHLKLRDAVFGHALLSGLSGASRLSPVFPLYLALVVTRFLSISRTLSHLTYVTDGMTVLVKAWSPRALTCLRARVSNCPQPFLFTCMVSFNTQEGRIKTFSRGEAPLLDEHRNTGG
jgi:hypothetical protein